MRQPNRRLKETPIERIFRNVVGRKMTSDEKSCLQLKGKMQSLPRNSNIGAGSRLVHVAKLTHS
jgi:hypothetical protein